MDDGDSHEHPLQQGDDSSHSSERSKLTIQEKIVQAGKDAVRKTKHLGRRKGSHRRQSTNPIALAATRVYRESVKASKSLLNIVSTQLSKFARFMWQFTLPFTHGASASESSGWQCVCRPMLLSSSPDMHAVHTGLTPSPSAGQQEWTQRGGQRARQEPGWPAHHQDRPRQ